MNTPNTNSFGLQISAKISMKAKPEINVWWLLSKMKSKLKLLTDIIMKMSITTSDASKSSFRCAALWGCSLLFRKGINLEAGEASQG